MCSGDNKEDNNTVHMNESHKVRCCSTDKTLGWDDGRCQKIEGVYVTSRINKECNEANFNRAVKLCLEAGGRLCSPNEHLDECTKGGFASK